MSLTVNIAEEILRERYDFFASNINAGNIGKVVAEYYTKSAYATGHETPLMLGQESLEGLFEEIHAEFRDMSIHMVDTRVAGDDCIYSLVTATSTLASSGESAAIKSLLVFIRLNGEWRCDADIFALGGF